MKIEQLQQLLKIVEKGSMNEAAKDLFLARSSLSASMKQLEQELGEPIFRRHSKGVSLTPFGSSVYAQAGDICERISFLQSVSHRGNIHKLNIASMYCSMANEAFGDLVRAHYLDEMDVCIEEMPVMSVIRFVLDGLCDLGIITIFSDNEQVIMRKIDDNGMAFHELVQRQLGAIVGPRNPLFHGAAESVTLAELQKFPHLENYSTPTDHLWEHRFLSRDGYCSNYLMSDLGLALRIVEETNAVMVDAHDKDVYDNLYTHNQYRFIPIKDYPECRTGWISVKHNALSPLAQEYLNLLTERADKAT